jgi:putative ABC transport system permease protein
MSPADLLYLVFHNLKRMKMRAGMTASGVGIGTLAVVLLVSLGFGLRNSFMNSVGRLGDLTLLPVSPQIPVSVRAAGEMGISGAVMDENALQAFREIPGVLSVTPHEVLQTTSKIKFQGLEFSGNIRGIYPEEVQKLGFKMASGEARSGGEQVFVGASVGENAIDIRRNELATQTVDLQDQWIEVVLTRYLYELASDPWNVPTEDKTLRLRVVGVVEKTGGMSDHTIYMLLNDVESLSLWVNGQRTNRERLGYEDALVRVGDTRSALLAEQVISDMGYRVSTARQFLERMNRSFLMIQAMLAGVGAIALLVSAFGIANTMNMAIFERTREIGLVKSLGATNAEVMSIFVAEAGVIGFLGGLGGILSALGISQVFNSLIGPAIGQQAARYFTNIFGPMDLSGTDYFFVTPGLLVFGLVFALLAGMLSGIFPAVRAASLEALDALRYE